MRFHKESPVFDKQHEQAKEIYSWTKQWWPVFPGMLITTACGCSFTELHELYTSSSHPALHHGHIDKPVQPGFHHCMCLMRQGLCDTIFCPVHDRVCLLAVLSAVFQLDKLKPHPVSVSSRCSCLCLL